MLRVGLLAPIAWRTPPRAYGPWERVVSLLAEGLVARGIDVTLFATADSETRARLVAVCPRPLAEDPSLDYKVWESLHIAAAYERARELDVLHNHFDFLPLTYSRLVDVPIVTTIHGFSSPRILPAYRAYADRVHYVSISDADRAPGLPYIATVHHGIDLSELTFSPRDEGYLAWLGRIHPDKGTVEAIRAAEACGLPLVLAGIVQDQAYFERDVLPRVDGTRVRYVGAVGPAERDRLLGGARALLHLIGFDEPFGLSMVEAMACGTPVIGARRGSVPEVIDEGLTGFVVDDVDGAVRALARVGEIDRAVVRRTCEARFSRERMVEDYLRVYERIRA